MTEPKEEKLHCLTHCLLTVSIIKVGGVVMTSDEDFGIIQHGKVSISGRNEFILQGFAWVDNLKALYILYKLILLSA